eukprot:1772939-Lingulodinium_polyedra.AAC.1
MLLWCCWGAAWELLGNLDAAWQLFGCYLVAVGWLCRGCRWLSGGRAVSCVFVTKVLRRMLA